MSIALFNVVNINLNLVNLCGKLKKLRYNRNKQYTPVSTHEYINTQLKLNQAHMAIRTQTLYKVPISINKLANSQLNNQLLNTKYQT